jgi:hypothetical protein
MDSTALMNRFFCEMLGSHRSEHRDHCLVECDVMRSVKWVPQKHGYFFARLHRQHQILQDSNFQMGLTRTRTRTKKKNKKMQELEWQVFPFQNFPQAKNYPKNAQYRFQKLVKLSNVFTYILLSSQLQAPHSNSANIHFISGADHTKSHEYNQITYVLNIQKHMHVRTVSICNISNINTDQLGSAHWCSTVTNWS